MSLWIYSPRSGCSLCGSQVGTSYLCKGPVDVVVIMFTDEPDRLRLDEKKMCQTQGFNPVRLFRYDRILSACFFSSPEKCNFYFFHRNLYRHQCSWSCFNKKHWQIMELEAGGVGVGQRFLCRHQWLKGKCNRNEHVLMFGLGGMWGEKLQVKGKPTWNVFEVIISTCRKMIIDRRKCCFFPVDIACYEKWHLVVAIFCS